MISKWKILNSKDTTLIQSSKCQWLYNSLLITSITAKITLAHLFSITILISRMNRVLARQFTLSARRPGNLEAAKPDFARHWKHPAGVSIYFSLLIHNKHGSHNSYLGCLPPNLDLWIMWFSLHAKLLEKENPLRISWPTCRTSYRLHQILSLGFRHVLHPILRFVSQQLQAIRWPRICWRINAPDWLIENLFIVLF